MDLEPTIDEQAQSAAQRHEVLRQLWRGIGGYPAFQHTLADLVSPREAEEARCAVSKALRALQATFAVLFLLLPVRVAFETTLTNAAVDIYLALNLMAILVLVSYFQIPYAGRLLVFNEVLISIVVAMSGGSLSSGNERGYVPGGDPNMLFAYAVTYLPGMFLGGWFIDFAASTQAGRKWPRVRRVSLAAFGLLGALGTEMPSPGSWKAHPADQILNPVLTVVLGLVLGLWALFVVPYCEHRRRSISEDGLTVYDAAIIRWVMHISGRLLALAVVAVTAFAWLRAIDSVEQMTPRGNSMDYVRLTTPLPNNAVATDTLLFWPRLARPLKASDFQQPHRRIYALGAADLVAAQKQLAAAGKRYRFQDTVTIDGRSYKTLLSLWGKHRVSSPQQLLAPGGDLQPRQLWVLEQIPRRTLLADDEGGAPKFFYVVEPLSRKLLRYRESELPKIGIVVFSWSVPTVLFGALAFLVLWRRGGDSSMARWAGIWLGGVAAWSIDVLVRQNFVKIDMPSVALAAQDSTGGRFMLVLYATLMLIFATVTLLHNAFVPQWALYAYFSRLQTPVAHGHTWISRYRTPIFLMMVGVANYGFFLWLSNMEYNQKIATIGAVNIGMMCVCWLWQGRHGQRQHAVSWNAVLAFLAANMLIWLINMPGRKAHDFGVLLNVLVSLLFIFWFARAVFHDDLLRLAGGRDISFIVSVIVLPIVFEASAEHARAILHGLGLFSETATGIIGTVAVVLLVHPFQHLLSTIFTRLANPGLSRVRKVIDQYTEEATESGNLAGRGDPALQIFYGMGITRFGFYACGAAGHLIELINNLDNDTPEIQISPSLRKKLSETKTFIDLKSAAFEWHYFYEQFELCRLERQLGCRYLFPVCLGHSLRAILCLGDDASSRKLARDAYSEHINNLGIAKLSSTPATRPPSAR